MPCIRNKFRVIDIDDGELVPFVLSGKTGLVSSVSMAEVNELKENGMLLPLDVVRTGLVEYRINLSGEPVAYFQFKYINTLGYIVPVYFRGEQIKLLSSKGITREIK